jgi:hypothetical protein
MPTPYGLSIIRIVTDNSTSDLEIVHALQDQLSIRAVPRVSGPVAPKWDLSLFSNPYYRANSTSASLAEAVLRLTALLAPYNEPIVEADRACVASVLQLAGCRNGTFVQPANSSLDLAVSAFNASAAALLLSPSSSIALRNNWTMLAPHLIGSYASEFVARSYIAETAYLALTSDQALYTTHSSLSSTVLSAGQALLVRFSRKPILKSEGFWSLTVYGEDLFFVPNELDRYAVGDQSNLTYPDGRAVHGGNGEGQNDGPFEVLIQPEDVVPPTNWTANWVPSQSGGGGVEWNCKSLSAL